MTNTQLRHVQSLPLCQKLPNNQHQKNTPRPYPPGGVCSKKLKDMPDLHSLTLCNVTRTGDQWSAQNNADSAFLRVSAWLETRLVLRLQVEYSVTATIQLRRLPAWHYQSMRGMWMTGTNLTTTAVLWQPHKCIKLVGLNINSLGLCGVTTMWVINWQIQTWLCLQSYNNHTNVLSQLF